MWQTKRMRLLDSLLCLTTLFVAAMPGSYAFGQSKSEDKMIPFYIGTYTGPKSEGIYRSQLDLASGNLAEPQLVAKLDNPSFLTIHPTKPVLYAVSEVRRGDQRHGAQVMAYRMEADGKLTEIGGQPSAGQGPCYVSTDQTGTVALVANYGSGSIASLPINDDGSLAPPASGIQHEGKSVNPQRQEGPHAHCIISDPSNEFACAVDLGLDQVLVYKLHHGTGKLEAQPSGNYRAAPGNGPRHLAFHPDGKHAFVNHEIASKLSSIRWQAGRFHELETLSTLPTDNADSNSTAETLVHPNGKFVYCSNRGHNSIAIFAFDAAAEKLTVVGHASTLGKTPRNFRIDPTGHYLLAENQGSDSIVPFRIDPSSGQLTPTGNSISVGGPCCIKFVLAK